MRIGAKYRVMADLSEIDHEGTDNIICPYCGHEHTDLGTERDMEEDEADCEDCGRFFDYQRLISVEYTTYKKGD